MYTRTKEQKEGEMRKIEDRGTIRRGSHVWDNVLWQPRVITLLVTFNSPRIRNTACKSILSDRPFFLVLVFIQTHIYIRLACISIDAPQRVALRVHSWLDLLSNIPPFTVNRKSLSRIIIIFRLLNFVSRRRRKIKYKKTRECLIQSLTGADKKDSFSLEWIGHVPPPWQRQLEKTSKT